MTKPPHSGSGWLMKSPRLPPVAIMKVQSKITSYGVGPAASLAGTAPGPEPRTDPPPTTGQRRACSKKNVGHPNQKPSPGQPDRSQSLNIFQFNLDGLSEKKTELAHFLDKNNIHIAILQETRKGKSSENFHITNYTATHCVCENCQGSITYIRNDITGQTNNQPENSTCIQKSTI